MGSAVPIYATLKKIRDRQVPPTRALTFSSKILEKIGRYPLPPFLVKFLENSNPNFYYTEIGRYPLPFLVKSWKR